MRDIFLPKLQEHNLQVKLDGKLCRVNHILISNEKHFVLCSNKKFLLNAKICNTFLLLWSCPCSLTVETNIRANPFRYQRKTFAVKKFSRHVFQRSCVKRFIKNHEHAAKHIAKQIRGEDASHGMFHKTRWKTFRANVRIKGANSSSFVFLPLSLSLSLSLRQRI